MSARDHIFISYRRDDARGASGRLYDWLRIAFGRERVFRDVHSIGVGNWRNKIDVALARSAACVAVIGPRWAEGENLARLAAEGDLVRHELLAALASAGLTMVPTLVEGAEIPDPAILPPELRPLFDPWNALSVSETGWEDDTRRLIAGIAAETSLPVGPDLDILLRSAGAAQHIGEREQARDLQAGQIAALQGTIDDLRSKLAEASSDERSTLAAAFAALARGDTRAAEAEFEREFETSRRKGADAARNVANLALLHDTAKAVAFYRKALELEADNAETTRLLGVALITFGDLQEARTVLSRSLQLALAQDNAWGEMAAQADLGRIAQLLGNLQQADTALSRALELAERRLAADPDNLRRQDDLWVIRGRVGELRAAQGDGPGALAAYTRNLAMDEALAARDPANADWQRRLAVSHRRIGDALVTQGDTPGALAAHARSLAIAEALAARDPANTEWQRDLSIGHEMIGNILVKQGDETAALAAHAKGLAIREALAARDPANTEWQRDLSIGHRRIGDGLLLQGDAAGARAAYTRDLSIAEALATRDPANADWQRDLAVSHSKIGDVLAAQGDTAGALAAYAKGLAIDQALTARDPTNAGWQRDLAVSHGRIGNMRLQQRDYPGALAAYAADLAITEALVARDPTNTEWQRDLSISHYRIGDARAAQDDEPGAFAAFARRFAIVEALAARDPANTQWQTDLAISHFRLGTIRHGQSEQARLDHLRRGRDLLLGLKASGWLSPGLEPLIEIIEKELASPPRDEGGPTVGA